MSRANFRNKTNASQPPKKASFFLDVLNQKKRLQSENDAGRFFSSALEHDDKMDMLYSLTDPSKKGSEYLRTAFSLTFGTSNQQLLNDSVIKFLARLGSDDLSKGSAKHCTVQCFIIAFKTPGALLAIQSGLERGTIKDLAAIAWFLVAVIRSDGEARRHHEVHAIAELLQTKSDSPAVQEIITVLFPEKERAATTRLKATSKPSLLDAEGVTSLEQLQAFEPQHDNDFPFDFRDIQILPTAGEINSLVSTASGAVNNTLSSALQRTEHQDAGERTAAMLDRQFRLLREDMIAPMREELAEELKAEKSKRRRIFNAPMLVDITLESRDSVPSLLIRVEMPVGMKGRLASMKQKEKTAFFEGVGKRVLAKESMLLFVGESGKVDCVGLVSRRDVKELISVEGHLQVGVVFKRREELVELLTKLDGHQHRGGSEHSENSGGNKSREGRGEQGGARNYARIAGRRFSSFVFQASSSYFSYEPVLRRLQNMTSIPFTEEIVAGKSSLPLSTLVDGFDVVERDLPAEIEEKLQSDPSQLEAIQSITSSRLVLVQGPPGTGKTYCGVQATRALLHCSNPSKERILCLCYTNHALDDFLLSLHEDGLPLSDIVRIGKSPKIHEKLRGRSVGELSEMSFNRTQRRCFAILKEAMQNSTKEICRLKEGLSHRDWGPNWWRTASEFLKDGDDQQVAAYNELLFSEKNADADGLQRVGKGGKKAAGEDHLWRRWCEGKPKFEGRISNAAANPVGSIWNLNKSERKQLMTEWQEEWIKPTIDAIADAMINFETKSKELETLRTETKVNALYRAKVIGSTTTAAAKNSTLLEQVQPTIVIIEEAAEILEANVLSSLGPSVKQLIMIGDHKQLRPKLECYHLRKESGRGIDFDMSLFERLATQQDFPIHTLNVQHRMRPEISELIRSTTYPQLQDHPRTQQRADIIGVAPNSNVIFLSHSFQESNDSERAMLGMNSKVNIEEAALVSAILNYLLQQGYQKSEIVILTPYLGQLVQIQKKLAAERVNFSMGDLDRSDLKKIDPNLNLGAASKPAVAAHQNAGATTAANPATSAKHAKTAHDGNGKKWREEKEDKEEEAEEEEEEEEEEVVESVRIATVDNFQGEEARIIIASLVRSNKEGDIGFVSGAERVNVLLSRARDGMVLVGNASTFRKARSASGRQLWCGILDLLEGRGQVHKSFPAMCENHGTVPDKPLNSADAFLSLVPHGGCFQPCNFPLPSCPNSHPCPLKCHSVRCSPTGTQLASNFCLPVNNPAAAQAACHSAMTCKVSVSVKCPATASAKALDAHYVSRVCSDSIPAPCMVQVADQCLEGHSIMRSCHAKATSVSCTTCWKIRSAAREKEQAQKRQQDKLQQAEQHKVFLAATLDQERDKLASRHQLERLQKETTLLNKAIAKYSEKNIQAASSQISASIRSSTAAHTASSNLNGAEIASGSVLDKSATKKGFIAKCDQIAPSKTVTTDNFRGPTSARAVIDDAKEMDGTSTSIESEDSNDESVDESSDLRQHELTASAFSMQSQPTVSLQMTSNKLRTMLKSATAEDWIQLYEGATACAAESSRVSVLGVASELFLLLSRLHFAGYSAKLQQEVDELYERSISIHFESKVTDSNVVNLTLAAVASFVRFAVSQCDSSMPQTTIACANDFVWKAKKQQSSSGDSSSLQLPHTWLEQARAVRNERADSATSSGPMDGGIVAVADSVDVEWQKLCDRLTESPSAAVDVLMKMIGLKSIKEAFVSMYHRIQLAKEQRVPAAASYNIRFDGNPGTGKTTVAKLYGQFLVEIGVLPEKSVVKETTGSKLITLGVRGLTKMLEELKEVGGGVIFVDEAYQLNPQNDREGRQVLDFLLVHAEKLQGEYGDIVWVFAGYKKDMDKLFEHNPGLPSRFPNHFLFEDYSDEELLSIFNDLLTRGGRNAASDALAEQEKKQKERREEEKKKQEAKKKAEEDRKKTSLKMQSMQYGYQQHRPDQRDQWGNLWRWDSATSTYVDEYDNITGYGVNGLGSIVNPLMSRKDNTAWIFNASSNSWYDRADSTRTSDVYPGKPATKKKSPSKKTAAPLPFTVSDAKWARIAIRRVGRGRGRVGFGNARAVRILFDLVRSRQAVRITAARRKNIFPDIQRFERDDLLGPKASEAVIRQSTAWNELQAMEGLQEVKEEMQKLIGLVAENANREDDEKPMLGVALNRVFLGNPGTGKTTVAALYARILSDLGLLSKGEVILKNSSDFIGAALGTSESITRGILQQAEGSVLVIDEAYGLNPAFGGSSAAAGSGSQDPYKTAVIDTIVEQVQGVPGEDRAVVMLGYKKEMEAMMAAANPGLSRRFQMENAFNFSDYDDTALVRILMKRAKKDGLQLSLPAALFAVKQLAKARAQPNFGNAGAVNNLLSTAKLNCQTRLRSQRNLSHARQKKATSAVSTPADELINEDFCPGGKLPKRGGEEDIFSDLFGCDQILEKLKEYRATIKFAQSQGKDPKALVEFNFLFVGSPGTGKTTVARKMGALFNSLGLLPTADVVEITAADLTTGFAGQAGKKAADVMTKARGKVLFIDEAYQLNPASGGAYMQEVVDAMVQAMTSEELKGRLVIILAGYERDIDDMLQVNQGLRSRFSEKLHFADFTPATVAAMLTDALRHKHQLEVSSDLEAAEIRSTAEALAAAPNFGNGRDVDTLAKRIVREFALRINEDKGGQQPQQLIAADLARALESFLKTKNQPPVRDELNTSATSPPSLPLKQQQQQQRILKRAPSLPATVAAVEAAKAVAEEADEDEAAVRCEAAVADDSGWGGAAFVRVLQDLLDERGLNSAQGVAHLSTQSLDSAEMVELAAAIASLLGISADEATDKLREWMTAQADVREKMEKQAQEVQLAKQQKRKALVPIWRCAVCGCADKNYIACYVAPFIVRYDSIDV